LASIASIYATISASLDPISLRLVRQPLPKTSGKFRQAGHVFQVFRRGDRRQAAAPPEVS